jgi:hypothetical protein
MNQLKIDENNRSAIKELLESIQGKSNVNLLYVSDIIQFAEAAEETLDEMGITVKNRSGAEFYFQPAGPTALSYKFGQGATSILIIRKSKNWFIAEIKRIKVYPRSKRAGYLILTEVQKNFAVKEFCRSFATKSENQANVSQ